MSDASGKSGGSSSVLNLSVFDDIVNAIVSGNMQGAMGAIEEKIKAQVSKGPKLDSAERRVLAQLCRYKFIVRVLNYIYQLKQSEDPNAILVSADMSNVLLLVKTSPRIKPMLYKFAVPHVGDTADRSRGTCGPATTRLRPSSLTLRWQTSIWQRQSVPC